MTNPSPPGLGERGSALWREFTAGRSWDAAGLLLLVEVCRLADRLERLDELLRGDTDAWARLVTSGATVTLQVDSALAEARLHAGALRQLLSQLRMGVVVAPSAPAPPAAEVKGSKLDELSRARSRRGARTSDPGSATRG